MKIKNELKNARGITLIALVITIIVLLILAGVTIATLTGDNGILTRANEAKEYTEIGKEKEWINLSVSTIKANHLSKGENGTIGLTEFEKELKKYDSGVTVTGEKDLIITFSSGRTYTYNNEDGNIDSIYDKNSLLWEYDEITGTIIKYIGENIDEIETLVIPSEIDGTKIKSIRPLEKEGYYSILGNYSLGKNIKNVIIEEGIEEIGEYAFECMKMINVELPSTIKTIKEWEFSFCEQLETINLPEGLEKIEGGGSFEECISLKEITFPSTLTEIGEEAFYDCYSLDMVYIPKTLTSIHYSAFNSGCAYIEVDKDNPNYKSIDGVLFNKDGKQLLTYCAGNERMEYTVPNGTEIIKEYAFDTTKSLVTINIPNSVQTIENGAFFRTYNLKTINIDRSENAISGSKWRADNSVQVNWTGIN